MRFSVLTLITVYSVGISAQGTGYDEIRQKIESGICEFTVKLSKIFHDKANAEENVFFSPINIYAALSLIHLGAFGDTKDEVSQLLALPSNNDETQAVHENLGKILKRVQNSRKTEIIVADNIFVQSGYPFKVAYLNQARSYYKADITGVNFKDGKSNATESINRWVSNKTKGRIPQLLSSDLPSDTVMLLATTSFFSGSWMSQFVESLTTPEKFNTGVKDVEVPMMNNKKDVPYSNNPTLRYEAISLQYYGNELSMFLVLPYVNQTLKNLTSHLNPASFRQLIEDTMDNYTHVQYKVPRMKFKYNRKLNDDLSQLGVKSLFDHPKLTNMVTTSDIKVSEIVHAAEIEVQEKGTVATAVTTLSFVPLSLPLPPVEPIPFHLNRPFMFFIYHFETKVILFSGFVYKPIESI